MVTTRTQKRSEHVDETWAFVRLPGVCSSPYRWGSHFGAGRIARRSVKFAEDHTTSWTGHCATPSLVRIHYLSSPCPPLSVACLTLGFGAQDREIAALWWGLYRRCGVATRKMAHNHRSGRGRSGLEAVYASAVMIVRHLIRIRWLRSNRVDIGFRSLISGPRVSGAYRFVFVRAVDHGSDGSSAKHVIQPQSFR